MKIAIRADASIQIGSGHVMRCLTLATELRRKGADVAFVCRTWPGNLGDIIKTCGFELHLLPANPAHVPDETSYESQPAHMAWLGATWKADAAETGAALGCNELDWLVVDHYALGAEWESEMRHFARRILAIDDIADRTHSCDVLLDQNLHCGQVSRYGKLVPKSCRLLEGPVYALLRDEFVKARNVGPRRHGSVRRIFVSFGGTDPTGETIKTLDAILALGRADIGVDVVVGTGNPRRLTVEGRVRKLQQATMHCQYRDIARLMAAADLSLGAGGTSTWERCAVGLPTLIIAIAENQEPISEEVAKAGAAVYLGPSTSVSVETIACSIAAATADPALLRALSERAMELVDGKGTGRVVAHLRELH